MAQPQPGQPGQQNSEQQDGTQQQGVIMGQPKPGQQQQDGIQQQGVIMGQPKPGQQRQDGIQQQGVIKGQPKPGQQQQDGIQQQGVIKGQPKPSQQQQDGIQQQGVIKGQPKPGQQRQDGTQQQVVIMAQPKPGQQQQYGMQQQVVIMAQPQPGQQQQYGMQQQVVIMAQPQPGQPWPGQQMGWMQPPAPIPGCPPGMEYLSVLDQILIKQETSLVEVLTGWEVRNKFRIMNSMGQQVYYALEESDMCQRQWCGAERGFIYHITDNMIQEVFRIRREFRCCSGCYWCWCESCYYFASIEGRNGQVLGHVSNLQFCCAPLFGIWDANKSLVAEVRGPCCECQDVCCPEDIEYFIYDMNSQCQIGQINKQWTGCIKECFTDSNNYRVSFPVQTDVKIKALMIGAVFIIDMMLYESQSH